MTHHNQAEIQQEREISQHLISCASKPVPELLDELKTTSSGLKSSNIDNIIKEHGYNLVIHDKSRPWYLQLLGAFNNPFNYILLLLALVSAITGDNNAMIIIVIMVLLSVIIKFTQEYKSSKSAEALKAMVHTTCSVCRISDNGQPVIMEIPLEQLVPGDIIQLAAGDIIPADIRILHSKNLYVSQSALTGESLPVEKKDTLAENVSNALELDNICFMGTNVDIGTATAVVLETGSKTYFGSMAKSLTEKQPPTAFDIGINKVSWVLIRFMLIMVPVVFFLNGFTKGSWLDALLFALSVAVGLTPELLPMIVTSNLAKGAVRMSKEKVIVKKLSAIQNFGAMDVLCTDKTGTLTQDQIILEKHLDIFLNDSNKVLEYAFLNSHFQTGLKNVMDMAIIHNEDLKNKDELINAWKELDELPFDFIRRRMSVILEHRDTHIMICKGAVEEMLACSSSVSTASGDVPITEELKNTIHENAAALNRDGLRVIAIGHRYFSKEHGPEFTVAEECDLVLDGFAAFLDPPKETAKDALAALRENGIKVMVLTGDNDVVTKKVCHDVGFDDEDVILGSELDKLPDEEAIKIIEQHCIFAKLSPLQKCRIVTLLRNNGHTVGFMGDGINDAVSLKQADVGISVDTAVDISKESADMILLQKSLMVLHNGVIEGRKTFANTIKYLKITASSNFGNVFSLIGASAMFKFLPMLPLQILILNLIYDISQITIPWDNVDKDFLSKPRKWKANDIQRFMIFIGPSSSIFDYVTFGVMFFVICPLALGGVPYHLLSGADQLEFAKFFQSGWFIESLFTQTLIVQVLRTEKVPFFQSRASWIVLLTSCLLLTIGVALPYTAAGRAIGFAPLPLQYFYWLAGILLAYCVLTQFLKRWYIRRFKSWL